MWREGGEDGQDVCVWRGEEDLGKVKLAKHVDVHVPHLLPQALAHLLQR